jgi:hypothetical protein
MSTEEVVEVFLGEPVENATEDHVLRRLCADLTTRGVHARVHANFVATGQQHRQVDLFVVTKQRAAHIEVKGYTPAGPLTARVNGPWEQTLPDGERRSLDGNAYRQAQHGTYALSDLMRRLARRGEVPAHEPFFKHLDTIVCLYPQVSNSSTIEEDQHVTLIGYDDLLERLTRPGPQPNWSRQDWDTFTRELALYPQGSGEDDPLLAQQHELADYRRRFATAHPESLHELVPLDAEIDGTRGEHPDLAGLVRHAQLVAVVGPSGVGKTHATAHAAMKLARAGHTVIWSRCDEYRSGKLSVLLARAAAPYSTVNVLSLINWTTSIGREAVLVLDGLNECSDEARPVLMEQLASLRLRHRVGVIITSTQPVSPVEETSVIHVRPLLPNSEQRTAILRSHSGGRLERHSDAFTTPYELSLAAQCAQDLPPEASRAELYDAYVRNRSGSLTTRAVLRRVARELDQRMASAVPEGELLATLERCGDPVFTPPAVDAALGCPLLARARGYVRFSHELLGRFLAADDLVHHATSGAELATLLDDARHRDLSEFAVSLETTPARRYGLLHGLADSDRLRTGILGGFGPDVQSRLQADVQAAFANAIHITSAAWLEMADPDSPFTARWQTSYPLNPTDRSLLVAAALCLGDGFFIDDVAALLEVTDQRCEHEIAQLRENEVGAPISVVVAATYGLVGAPDQQALPASLVTAVAEHQRMGRRHDDHAVPIASALWASGRQRRWGLLYLALRTVCPDNLRDQALFLELLTTAWRARGYHLQLASLLAAQFASRALQGSKAFDEVRRFLESLNPQHWGLSSTQIEALSAYDAVEPVSTLEDIQAEISGALTAPKSPEADAAAYRVFSLQF